MGQDEVEIISDNPKPKRTYTKKYPTHIKEEAVKLYVIGYSYRDIGGMLNVPPKTIWNWVRLQDVQVTRNDVETLKDRLTNRLLTDAMHLISNGMVEEKVKSSSTLQLMTSAGILMTKAKEIDEGRKESGNNYFVYVNRKDEKEKDVKGLESRIKEIEEEIEKLGDWEGGGHVFISILWYPKY